MLNLYCYVKNRPLKYCDLLGMITVEDVAKCGDVKVTYLGKIWKPNEKLQPTSFWSKKVPLVTWTWKIDIPVCKSVKCEYYKHGFSWIYIKQMRVTGPRRDSDENHELNEDEIVVVNKSGWSEQILAGFVPPEQNHIYMNPYLGGDPKAAEKEKEERNPFLQLTDYVGLTSPYSEPNEASATMSIPPRGPATSGKYSGMRIQVFVRNGYEQIWKMDSYFWFKERM